MKKKKQARYNRYTRSASRKDVDVAIECLCKLQ